MADPPPVVTVTSTVPAAWGGVLTVAVVAVVAVTVAALPPIVTVALRRFVPVIVTD